MEILYRASAALGALRVAATFGVAAPFDVAATFGVAAQAAKKARVSLGLLPFLKFSRLQSEVQATTQETVSGTTQQSATEYATQESTAAGQVGSSIVQVGSQVRQGNVQADS